MARLEITQVHNPAMVVADQQDQGTIKVALVASGRFSDPDAGFTRSYVGTLVLAFTPQAMAELEAVLAGGDTDGG